MYNRVELIGNVGADPDIRAMPNGDKVANIRLATSQKWRDKDGNRHEATEWHSVVVFGPLVQVVEAYVKKGDKLHVAGELRTRKWQDKNGADRYSTEVVLTGPRAVLNMLGGSGGAKTEQSTPNPIDDDIPF